MHLVGPEELTKLAYSVGFKETSAIMAIAIALSESGIGNTGCNSDAINRNITGPYPASTDVGIWQINSQSHAPKYTNIEAMKDPKANALAAWEISKQGTDFDAWTTVRNQE